MFDKALLKWFYILSFEGHKSNGCLKISNTSQISWWFQDLNVGLPTLREGVKIFWNYSSTAGYRNQITWRKWQLWRVDSVALDSTEALPLAKISLSQAFSPNLKEFPNLEFITLFTRLKFSAFFFCYISGLIFFFHKCSESTTCSFSSRSFCELYSNDTCRI